jgi:hypothetical protein
MKQIKHNPQNGITHKIVNTNKDNCCDKLNVSIKLSQYITTVFSCSKFVILQNHENRGDKWYCNERHWMVSLYNHLNCNNPLIMYTTTINITQDYKFFLALTLLSKFVQDLCFYTSVAKRLGQAMANAWPSPFSGKIADEFSWCCFKQRLQKPTKIYLCQTMISMQQFMIYFLNKLNIP